MAKQQGGKGNPASKRMSNARLKVKRARSWSQGQDRKKASRKANDLREQRNRDLRANGRLTAWEEAQAKRRQERKAA